MCGGSEWYRKGMDVVLEVFNKLQLPDAELHIKIVPPHLFAPKDLEYPNVIVHREWLTVEQERDLVRSMDGFISVSRGEGFGLMPLQAIASGIPTIISDSTGQAQFTDLAFGVVPCGKSKAETTGQWDEPDQKVLEELMVEAYENRDAAKTKAKQGVVGSKAFSWDSSARRFVGLIPAGTLLPDPKHVPPNISVEIHTVRKVNAYIGNATYVLEPDKTYVVPENVYKVLSDSGAIR
jgi:glycosyltransferase involved in cell wall biosynthesis